MKQGDESLHLHAFIGQHAEAYEHDWLLNLHERRVPAWHWGGFLFSFAWLAYRRMYGYTSLFLMSWGLIFFFLKMGDVSYGIAGAFLLGFPVLCGYWGHSIYRSVYRTHLETAYRLYANTPRNIPHYLRSRGQTDGMAACFSIVLFAALNAFLIFWIGT